MQCQKFDCAAEGQAKFISFCENLESLYPQKSKREEQKKAQEEAEAKSTAKCCSHLTNEYNIIKNAAQCHEGKDGNWHDSNSSKGCKQYSKQELNGIVSKIIKEVLKKACCKPCDQQEANAINQFDALSISSDDSSDDNRRATLKRGHAIDDNIDKLNDNVKN
eukprot:11599631-Ditylum_brightwellii.AAC.1